METTGIIKQEVGRGVIMSRMEAEGSKNGLFEIMKLEKKAGCKELK